ncbi:MAG TPA: hypothetical protein VLA61_26600 [Ideonella sp.]|nr:hypothetical protein [Ideonella sp.]
MDQARLTALHEAGHALAHVRLQIDQMRASIVPTDELQGAVLSNCDVWTAAGAEDMAIADCAGCAALKAVGQADDAAAPGCDSDFESAESLADDWSLEGGLEGCKSRAVDLMSRPENLTAVALIAEHLLMHLTLDAEYTQVLVDVADGETTEEEFERYLSMRGHAPPFKAAG